MGAWVATDSGRRAAWERKGERGGGELGNKKNKKIKWSLVRFCNANVVLSTFPRPFIYLSPFSAYYHNLSQLSLDHLFNYFIDSNRSSLNPTGFDV